MSDAPNGIARLLRRSLLPLSLAFPLALPLAVARASSPVGAGEEADPAVEALRSYPTFLGTDWYPEQWPESRWEEDLRLMEAAHMRVVRVAEFAWSALEPSEGRYDLDWLERAIALAAKHGILTVLGTPTAAPPAWLTSKYPDTLRVEPDGRRVSHGGRAHGSVTSPRYLDFCGRIASEMARRFGHNPSVIGWQIDNEYGYALMSYDDFARQAFQDWLRTRHKTLESLNARWTTAYWSETYDSWGEIPIPVGGHNPGLMLDWKRFVTASWAHYQQVQIDAMRPHLDPRQFVTGNLMGFFDGFDHYIVTRPLTMASWDSYIGTGHVDADSQGLAHDLMRGLKRRNFWLLETQPGAVNWSPLNNFLNRGEVRAMAWESVGHGADEIGYWQWRSALNGQEQYHGTLVGPDGTPVPLYEEIKQLGEDFVRAGDQLKGTSPVSQVALLYSYDSRWAIEFQKHNSKYDQIAVLKAYYRALRRLSQSVDVVSADAPLDGYKLVVAPNLNLIPEELARHLSEYARGGGHLVLGPRSGMKDEFNSLLPQRQPGFLVDALGGRVEQYYALEKDVPVSGPWGAGEASVWAEQMKALSSDGEVLLRYGKGNGWLDDQPAALTRSVGKGRITYLGAVLDEKLMAAAAQWMVERSGVTPALGPVPDGVEVCPRSGGGKRLYVLVDFSPESRHVALPRPMKQLLAGREGKTLDLPPYGVEVLLDSATP
jgi:beta-galactosidase